MASVAVIQGANGALGRSFVQHLLKSTNLNVVATSRNIDEARSNILSSGDLSPGLDESRLTMIEMDLLDESSIAAAAKQVESQFGKASLKLLLNVSGVVRSSFWAVCVRL